MSPLLAHNAVVEIATLAGKREVRLSEFRDASNEPLLAQDEIITGLVVDPGLDAVGYSRVARRKAVSRGIASSVVTWRWNGEEAQDVRVAVGSTNFRARRVPEAESLLEGRRPTPELIDSAADAVLHAVNDAFESVEAETWYAREMSRVMTQRAGLQAAGLAGGEGAVA